MKKLLIMGGNAETVPLVTKAKELGYYVILSDDNPYSIAKQFADESFNINALDVEGIVSLSREKNIDGVLVGVADILVEAYYKVCDRLKLPCYTNEIVSVCFSRKDIFKEKLHEFDLKGVPELRLDSSNLFDLNNLSEIGFPLMVKPVDNGGGVGITFAQTNDELLMAIDFALANSRNKKVIVEKYMNCDDVGIYFTFQDGIYSTSLVYDRFTTNEQMGKSKVCLGGVYPSKYVNSFLNNDEKKLKALFSSLDIRNGVLMLSAFVENGNFYYYDVGFRLQGEAPNILLQELFGYDQKEMLIKFAMTGSMGEIKSYDVDDPLLSGRFAATVWILLRKGKISRIEGIDDVLINNNVVTHMPRLKVGDIIDDKIIGTEKQVYSRFYIVSKSHEKLKETIFLIQDTIKVYDEFGNNMVLNGFLT